MSAPRVVSVGALEANYARRGVQTRLHHALMLDGQGRKLLLLCGKIKLDNLADDYDAKPVDCPRCLCGMRGLRKVAKLASSPLAGGQP